MSIRCPACQAEQRSPAPGTAKPMCMKCGESLGPAVAAKPAAAPSQAFEGRTMSMARPTLTAADALPELSQMVAQATAEALAQPPAGGAIWHVRTGDGTSSGPVPLAVVQQWRAEGRLDANTIVWRPGLANWQPLAEALGAAPPPPPPPVAAPAAAAPAAGAPAGQPSTPGAGAGTGPATASFLAPADATGAHAPSLSQITARNARPWGKIAAAAVAAAVVAGLGAWSVARLTGGNAPVADVQSHAPAPEAAAAAEAAAQPAAHEAIGAADAENADEEAEETEAPKVKNEGNGGADKHNAKAKHHRRQAHRRAHHRRHERRID